MKNCSRCNQDKPRSEYHACSDNPDGLRGQCKKCRNAVTQESRMRKRQREAEPDKPVDPWEWIRELAQAKRGSHGFF